VVRVHIRPQVAEEKGEAQTEVESDDEQSDATESDEDDDFTKTLDKVLDWFKKNSDAIARLRRPGSCQIMSTSGAWLRGLFRSSH